MYDYTVPSEGEVTWSLGAGDEAWSTHNMLAEPTHYHSAPQVMQEHAPPMYPYTYHEPWRRPEQHDVPWSSLGLPQGVSPYDPYQAPLQLHPHPMMPASNLLPAHCYGEAYHPHALPPPVMPLPQTPAKKSRKKEVTLDSNAVACLLCSIPRLGTDIRYGLHTFHRLEVANVLDTYQPWFWTDPVVPDKRYAHLNAFYDASAPAPSVAPELCLENGTTVHMPPMMLFSKERPAEVAPLKLPTATVPTALVTKPFMTSSTLKVRCWAIGKQCRVSEAFAREVHAQLSSQDEDGSYTAEAPTGVENLELVFHHSKKHLLIQSVCDGCKCKHSFGYHSLARIIIYDVYIGGSNKALVGITIAVTERGDDSFKEFPSKTGEDAPSCRCASIMPIFNRPHIKSMGTHPTFSSREGHAGEFYFSLFMDRSYFMLNQRGSSGCSPMARMILGDPYLASITMVKASDRGIGNDKLEYRATSLWELRDRFACILELVYRCLVLYGPRQLSLLINSKLNHTFQVPRCIRNCCTQDRYAEPSPRCYDDEVSDSATIGASMSPSIDDGESEALDVRVRMAYREDSCSDMESDVGDGEMSDDDDYVVKSEVMDDFGDDDDGLYERRKPRRGGSKKRKSPSSRSGEMEHGKTQRKRKTGRSKKSKPKREPAMGAYPEDTFAFNYLDIAAIAQKMGVEIMSKTEAMYFMEVTHIGAPGICNYRREYAQLAKDGQIVMPILTENTIDTSKLMPVEEWNRQFDDKPELLASIRRTDSPRRSDSPRTMTKVAESPSCALSTSDESIYTEEAEEDEVAKKPSIPLKKKTKSSHIRVAVLLNKEALVKVYGPNVARLWTDFEKA